MGIWKLIDHYFPLAVREFAVADKRRSDSIAEAHRHGYTLNYCPIPDPVITFGFVLQIGILLNAMLPFMILWHTFTWAASISAPWQIVSFANSLLHFSLLLSIRYHKFQMHFDLFMFVGILFFLLVALCHKFSHIFSSN